MHKVEIAQQAIDISLRRRGAVQPFATIEPRKTALLVVDMQTGFVAPGAVAEIPVAREIVPNINRLANALRRAGGTIVWIVSTYGPGAERDWTTFFNFIITGEASDRFRLAFQEGKPEHTLWRELDRSPDLRARKIGSLHSPIQTKSWTACCGRAASTRRSSSAPLRTCVANARREMPPCAISRRS